jgi:hypothetical protein
LSWSSSISFGLIVALAKLLLDRLELLAAGSTRAGSCRLRTAPAIESWTELEHLELLDQDPVERVHARAHVERLEDFLFDRGGNRRELDAMKSASRPGSVMFDASVCRSSDSSGDSETTCWKFVLMLRSSASISSRSSSLNASTAGATRPAQIGARFRDALERQPRQPCTIRRRLPSGSLNILWI